ncbi:hypothetical protein ACOMHN_057213 [Nucella lapillus]
MPEIKIDGKQSRPSLLHIHYSEQKTNEYVRQRTDTLAGEQEPLLVKRRKLAWFGHVNRHDSLAKTILQGTVEGGRRRGRQRPDGIPPEVFKAGSQPLIHKFTEFLCMCWEDGCLPQDLKDARIVHLYKGKGDKSSCDKYRGISLLSIAEDRRFQEIGRQPAGHRPAHVLAEHNHCPKVAQMTSLS